MCNFIHGRDASYHVIFRVSRIAVARVRVTDLQLYRQASMSMPNISVLSQESTRSEESESSNEELLDPYTKQEAEEVLQSLNKLSRFEDNVAFVSRVLS